MAAPSMPTAVAEAFGPVDVEERVKALPLLLQLVAAAAHAVCLHNQCIVSGVGGLYTETNRCLHLIVEATSLHATFK